MIANGEPCLVPRPEGLAVQVLVRPFATGISMNISRNEQRVLHALAQGGMIRHQRCGDQIVIAECFTRDGHVLADFSLATFHRLRRRGLVTSHSGSPYRISGAGLRAVRAQVDNR